MNDIPNRNHEQETARVSGLHDGRHERGSLVCDIEVICQDIENRMAVVEVRDTKGGGLVKRMSVL